MDGDIIAAKYIKCPELPGGREPCGAHFRKGVACSSWVSKGKCDRDHTAINVQSPANKKAWLEKVNSEPGMDFNPKRVTCFKKQGALWVMA